MSDTLKAQEHQITQKREETDTPVAICAIVYRFMYTTADLSWCVYIAVFRVCLFWVLAIMIFYRSLVSKGQAQLVSVIKLLTF